MLADLKLDDAYRSTASAFRFRRSGSYFEARVRDLGLGEMRNVKWEEQDRNGRVATVRGTFTLKDQSELPLNFVFLLEDGVWRLVEARSVSKTGASAEDVFAVAARTRDTIATRAVEILEPNAAVVPSETQLRQLAEDTLLLFNEAIQNGGDFSSLYAAASDRWKYRGRDPRELAYGGSDPARIAVIDPLNTENRLTKTALRRAFAAATDAKVDLSPIRGAKLILIDPARVNSDGVLLLHGTFDATVHQANMPGLPRRAVFSLEYVHESAWWKLFGITVNILAADKEAAANP